MPGIKYLLKEDLFHVLTSHFLDVLTVHIFKEESESTSFRVKDPELVLSPLETFSHVPLWAFIFAHRFKTIEYMRDQELKCCLSLLCLFHSL